MTEPSSAEVSLNPLCSAIVEVTKNNILQGVREELLSDNEMSGEIDCIMKSLRRSDFSNSLLLLYVYETAAEETDDSARTEKMHQAQIKVTRATFDSFMTCQAEKKFGQLFDDLLNEESSSEEEIDPKEDFCVRKHIVDHKLIHVGNHNLNLNPKNLDPSTFDCEALYQKALKDAEDELVKALLEENSSEEKDDSENTKPTSQQVSCILEVIRERNFIDQMLQYDYVKEMKLDETKQRKMRQNFINVMTRLADSASKCFLN